jgi:hypothetical protein
MFKKFKKSRKFEVVLKFFGAFFLRVFGHDLNVVELKTKKSFFLVNISTSGTSTVKPFKPVTGSTTFWRAFGAFLARFWRVFGALLAWLLLAGFWRAFGLAAFGGILARYWRAFGTLLARSLLARFWRAFVALLAHFWRAFCVLLARFWRAFGALLVCFWLGYFWRDFGNTFVITSV